MKNNLRYYNGLWPGKDHSTQINMQGIFGTIMISRVSQRGGQVRKKDFQKPPLEGNNEKKVVKCHFTTTKLQKFNSLIIPSVGEDVYTVIGVYVDISTLSNNKEKDSTKQSSKDNHVHSLQATDFSPRNISQTNPCTHVPRRY